MRAQKKRRDACSCRTIVLIPFCAVSLTVLIFVLSCLSSAFPAHYYAVRYHPAVSYILNIISRTNGSLLNSRHVRDISPTSISPEQVIGLLRAAYTRNFPIVIRGAIAHWPAAGKWSPDYVAERAGRDDWVVLQTGVQEQEAEPFVNTTLGSFADWLVVDDLTGLAQEGATQDRKAYYMAEEFDWVENYPSLMNELRLEEMHAFWRQVRKQNDAGIVAQWLGAWWERRSREAMTYALGTDAPVSVFSASGFETAFWMGAGGARTGWHLDHDFPLNVLCHLYGRKRLWIASPDETPALYPSNRYDPGAVLSSVNFWSPYGVESGPKAKDAASRIPLYADLKMEEVELYPGDVLFIPQGWWHAAETVKEAGTSVSLSVRSMTPWFWLKNLPDRVIEQLFWWGLWQPKEGNVERERTITVENLSYAKNVRL